MVTYCINIFQNKIRFSYYNKTFRCNNVILATILIDVINLRYIFVVVIVLVVIGIFSFSMYIYIYIYIYAWYLLED